MSLAFVGILSNALVILVNGGYMPIWEPSLPLAGLHPADVSTVAPHDHAAGARRLVPAPPRAARRRHPDPLPDHPERRVDRRRLPDRSVSPSSSSPASSASRRSSTRRSSPRSGRVSTTSPRSGARCGPGSGRRDRPVARPGRRGRSRAAAGPGQRRDGHGLAVAVHLRSRRGHARLRHGHDPAPLHRDRRARPAAPVRPARAQRLVLGAVGRPAHLAVRRPAQPVRAGRRGRSIDDRLARSRPALVFFVATLPNLLLCPIAGTFVDRWDRKEVMVVSDLLRAALVLLMPVAAVDRTSCSSTR